MGAPDNNENHQPDEVGGHTPVRSGAATPGGGGGGADGVAVLAEGLGVDYAWLAEQLAQLGGQLGAATLVDELEDEVGGGKGPGGARGVEASQARAGAWNVRARAGRPRLSRPS